MQKLEHGGGLDRVIAQYGGPRCSWLDLSTGINPVPYELPELKDDLWQRLPEDALFDRALAAAREFYGVPDDAGIVAAPGTQSIIQLLPHLLPAGTAAVVSPTYGEHVHAFSRAGRPVSQIKALADLPGDCALAVVVNPNNPDGRTISVRELSNARERLAKRGGCLVVDEAFADCGAVQSVVAQTGTPGLVVLKSFGKFFGLAGLRLGFAVADAVTSEKFEARLGPWAVSGPALAVASSALCDGAAIQRIRRSLRANSDSLEGLLRAAGLVIAGRTRFFVLVEHPNATELHADLCSRGIHVRRFDYAPRWLRFGLPASAAQRERLADTLADVLPGVGM